MITKQYIDDHQLVERYLADQLSDSEREEFENYYVEHPEILRDLQAAAGIKIGASLLRASGELKELTTQRTSSRWRPALALAASLLILVLGASYLFRSAWTPPVILGASIEAFATPLTLAATYQIQRTRSDVDAVVTLPGSPQAIKLRVRPVFEPLPAAYRIELSTVAEDDSQTKVATAEKLVLDGDGFITVYVDSAHLLPGNYALTVSNDADPAAAGANDFLIEVVAAEARS